ncbi:hypothetical protein AAFF_G00172850 [Aldrovandia affinis]|uniref:L-serine deaminase n=1 Tax=Aldrovandia affinis TaxID=143900 RepID=A0AAD7SYS7_9TELE|nr:hypothetical protein AAFF_G00172850 [Aldrovandia affinis]
MSVLELTIADVTTSMHELAVADVTDGQDGDQQHSGLICSDSATMDTLSDSRDTVPLWPQSDRFKFDTFVAPLYHQASCRMGPERWDVPGGIPAGDRASEESEDDENQTASTAHSNGLTRMADARPLFPFGSHVPSVNQLGGSGEMPESAPEDSMNGMPSLQETRSPGAETISHDGVHSAVEYSRQHKEHGEHLLTAKAAERIQLEEVSVGEKSMENEDNIDGVAEEQAPVMKHLDEEELEMSAGGDKHPCDEEEDVLKETKMFHDGENEEQREREDDDEGAGEVFRTRDHGPREKSKADGLTGQDVHLHQGREKEGDAEEVSEDTGKDSRKEGERVNCDREAEEDSTSTDSLTDDEMELHMHRVKSAHERQLARADPGKERPAPISVSKRPSVSLATPTALSSIRESLDEDGEAVEEIGVPLDDHDPAEEPEEDQDRGAITPPPTEGAENIAGSYTCPSKFAHSMEDTSVEGITLEMLLAARETVKASPLGVINTPMINWSQTTLPLHVACDIHIKMENLQRTGSFKIRGVANQFAQRPVGGRFVTMSAGNYGKAFAYASKHYGSQGKVVMPETAPVSRSTLIQSFGVEVERVPTSSLMEVVNRCVQKEDMVFLHSYDDVDLIAGHASLGFEVLEVVPNPDVVVVCCGGGGLLAGVATAIKLSGHKDTRIYGVEPSGACTMHRSFIEEKPVGMDAKSIASGLAPPFAGALPYTLCRRYVEDIVLVSDEEIRSAVSTLYRSGFLVEPSGAAAFAAVDNDRIPNIAGRGVVVVLSGGNIGKDELANFPD